MNAKLVKIVYNEFFARLADSPIKRDRYMQWTRMLVEWATTNKTNNDILSQFGYSIENKQSKNAYRSTQLNKILRRCKALNPKAYEQLKQMRQTAK